MYLAARIRAAIATCVIAAAPSLPTQAEEMRPAPDAALLMARYAVSTSSVVFGAPGTILKNVPEIAIYSDGTVLMPDEGIVTLPLRMHMAAIPADIAQGRFQKFYESLADAEANYPYNCWNTRSDGTQEPYSCVDDASIVNILLRLPEGEHYKLITVTAGYNWQRLRDMRDFVPSAYFDLMAWMDGLEDLPSKPWQAPSDAVPGFAPGNPVCQVAEDLCR